MHSVAWCAVCHGAVRVTIAAHGLGLGAARFRARFKAGLGAVQGWAGRRSSGLGLRLGAAQFRAERGWGREGPLRTDAHDSANPVVSQVHNAAPLQPFLVNGQGLRKVAHPPTDRRIGSGHLFLVRLARAFGRGSHLLRRPVHASVHSLNVENGVALERSCRRLGKDRLLLLLLRLVGRGRAGGGSCGRRAQDAGRRGRRDLDGLRRGCKSRRPDRLHRGSGCGQSDGRRMSSRCGRPDRFRRCSRCGRSDGRGKRCRCWLGSWRRERCSYRWGDGRRKRCKCGRGNWRCRCCRYWRRDGANGRGKGCVSGAQSRRGPTGRCRQVHGGRRWHDGRCRAQDPTRAGRTGRRQWRGGGGWDVIGRCRAGSLRRRFGQWRLDVGRRARRRRVGVELGDCCARSPGLLEPRGRPQWRGAAVAPTDGGQSIGCGAVDRSRHGRAAAHNLA